MAISAITYGVTRTLYKAGGLIKNASILEFGEANWYGDLPMETLFADIRDLVEDADLRQELETRLQTIIDENNPSAVFDAAKVFYRLFHGCEDLTCIDLHGTEISLPLDLNQPIELNRQFDVTVNNGLAEHVFLAGQVFDSMHRHTKPGGLMIHEAPLISGWLDHGFYNFQPTLFFDLARANDYTMAFFVGGGKPARVHQLSSREKVHEFVKAGRLPPDPAAMVVFRKGEEDTPFALPIQHAYADKAPDSLA
jgi:hypothetical protein